MDGSYIELPGCEIAGIEQSGETLTLRFARAYLIQTQSGAKQQSRWHQSGSLIFSDPEVEELPPPGPLVCSGGDVGENIYTYRDMIPIPLESRGRAHCNLRFEGSEQRLRLQASGVTLVMEDRPYYIEHIDKSN